MVPHILCLYKDSTPLLLHFDLLHLEISFKWPLMPSCHIMYVRLNGLNHYTKHVEILKSF